MKLLVAALPDAPSNNDFSFVPEGEVLYGIIMVCCNSDTCGCDRSLAGTITAKATTSARVEEIEMSEHELFDLAAKVGGEQGWGGPLVWGSFKEIRAGIEELEPGTIVRPKFNSDAEHWEYIPDNPVEDD